MIDRCDCRGCPAESMVWLSVDNDTMLSFCGSHFDQRMVALFAQGFQVILDNRPALRLAEAERK